MRPQRERRKVTGLHLCGLPVSTKKAAESGTVSSVSVRALFDAYEKHTPSRLKVIDSFLVFQ